MQANNHLHKISPEKVVRGEKAWEEAKELIPYLCNKPLILGRSSCTYEIRKSLSTELSLMGLNVVHEELNHDCCEIDLQRISSIAKHSFCDAIIASGGGKVLDAGKLIANRLNIPCITIPLSASTCAGWTALANIYSPKGSFIKDEILEKCPRLLIFDYSLVRKAPKRTLASGIADALAKWYEASISSGNSNDSLVQQAVQMARVLRDQLLINSKTALQDPNSDAWIKVAEGCALTAGLIGGIGGAKCRTAAAHAVHNGLTQLDFKKKSLHGELVGYGILVQLRIEELLSKSQLALQTKKQLIELLIDLDLPIDIQSLGLKSYKKKELEKACTFACRRNSEMHNLPFKVNENTLMEALLDANKLDLISSDKKNLICKK